MNVYQKISKIFKKGLTSKSKYGIIKTPKERKVSKMKWLRKIKERKLKKYWEKFNKTCIRYTEGG